MTRDYWPDCQGISRVADVRAPDCDGRAHRWDRWCGWMCDACRHVIEDGMNVRMVVQS